MPSTAKAKGKTAKKSGNSVTKATLTTNIVDLLGLSAKDSAAVVESIIDTMRETLAKGEEVLLSGFGKFVVVAKQERVGRNPITGAPVPIKARKVLKFRASDVLKTSLNEVK